MSEIPDILYFYDFLIREEELTPWHAGHVVKTLLTAWEHFDSDPAEVDTASIEEYATLLPHWKKGVFTAAIASWRKFTTLGEKARYSDARVPVRFIGELLGVNKNSRPLRWFTYYCVEKGLSPESFAEPYGCRAILLVPVEFYLYAKRMKEEDDARWLPNPFVTVKKEV
ncbi:MAG: hypothetical protein H0Z19_07430 [Archaeoglobus sp.]|uniref:hypothetical protein n=1 Tax=Archaeoglobus sp. TaxID=1872626 RepID=UPI001D28968F|nr:hypothetical protein [Archaeoglobus sp.]MBO8180296.1 hypothetical protein [Archaeoglobus sp.]